MELKNQYIIGYRSTNETKDGKWRKIHVKVAQPKGTPQLSIRTKSGYYAPSSETSHPTRTNCTLPQAIQLKPTRSFTGQNSRKYKKEVVETLSQHSCKVRVQRVRPRFDGLAQESGISLKCRDKPIKPMLFGFYC
jgi:hypothetical protein